MTFPVPGVRPRLLCLTLGALASTVFGEEFRVTNVERTAAGEISIEVPARSDSYYILLRGDAPSEVDQPVAIVRGTTGKLILNDIERSGATVSFYRVQQVPEAAPLDTDDDGLDDAHELQHAEILNPLRRSDGWSDPDRDGLTNWSEAQLGTNPQIANPAPFISTGVAHTMAIDATGNLWGWGSNAEQQLGSPAAAVQSAPVLVAPSADWAAASAGAGHSVAIKKDGTLWAWGMNGRGQLGIGNTEAQADPVRVGDGSDWLTVVASDEHTLAIKRDGSLWGWGRNDWGQVGDGTSIDRAVPVRIASETGWRAIASRFWFNVALRDDGTLWSWGYNNNGQLGDGSSEPRYTPVQIGVDTDWATIATGFDHALAVKNNGTLWGWGNSSSGRLGFGDYAPAARRPAQVGTFNDWATVACGGQHSLALKTDGTLWACGQNDNGQVANNTTFDQHAWRRITSAGDQWAAIAGGSRHSAALKRNRQLLAWGLNMSGQLGRGHDNRILSPRRISSATDWRAISTQILFNLALRADGTMWTWGAGYPIGYLTPVQVGQRNDWIAISAGREHNAALNAAGEIWTWGDGEEGQLGNGTTGEKLEPTLMDAATDWREISAGNWHNVALKSDRTLWVWGANDHAALGDGTLTLEGKAVPTQIGTAEWRAVAAGAYHTLALKMDGTLWGWGYSIFQQLTSAAATLQTSPLQLSDDTDWAEIVGGGYHTVALKTNGTLWHWGANHYIPVVAGEPPVPPTAMPTQAGTDSDWLRIAAGRWSTFAIKQNGTLWGWGRNASGQLGIGSLLDQPALVRVGTESDWVSVTAGAEHTIALKSDGTLWGWGSNHLGELGLEQIVPVTGTQVWGPSP